MMAVVVSQRDLEDLADPGARSIIAAGPDGPTDIVVVRWQGASYAYLNRCPHLGTPLETVPDRFFTSDGKRLLCSTHGAEFQVADGICVRGPCRGRRLEPIAVELVTEIAGQGG